MLENGKSDIFRQRYYFETQRQDRIKSNLSIPLSLIVLVFGVMVFYLKHLYLFINTDYISILFVVVFTTTILLIFLDIYYLIKSFYNYKYSYLPEPKEMKKYFEGMEEYCQKIGKDEALRKEIDNQMEIWFMEGAQKNMSNNDKRSGFIHRSNTTMIFIIISVIICSVLFFAKYTKTMIDSQSDVNKTGGQHYVKQSQKGQ